MENKNERGAAHFAEFVNAMMSIARKVLESLGEEQLRTIFDDAVNAHCDPGSVKPIKDAKLKKMRQLLIETPLPYIRNDIEEAFAEMGVNTGSTIEEKFQLLLDLREKYKNRTTKAWRPPLDPHEHMAAYRAEALQEELDKWQVLEAMKRNEVDRLKEEIKELMATCDLARTDTRLAEVERRLERIYDSNSRFRETHERVVDRIAEAVVKNSACPP